jgi:hypothetical protein
MNVVRVCNTVKNNRRVKILNRAQNITKVRNPTILEEFGEPSKCWSCALFDFGFGELVLGVYVGPRQRTGLFPPYRGRAACGLAGPAERVAEPVVRRLWCGA